jgi:hypothetical protein
MHKHRFHLVARIQANNHAYFFCAFVCKCGEVQFKLTRRNKVVDNPEVAILAIKDLAILKREQAKEQERMRRCTCAYYSLKNLNGYEGIEHGQKCVLFSRKK